MNRGKRSEAEYACCDESKMTCDMCSFEDSIKVKEENE
jgi:hypothetical protein